MSARDADYRPIRDYALIGDCRGSALVARDGGIDWAALHRFDADPVFCRLLDAKQGGFWSIRPCDEHSVTRAYLPGTNILRTVFTTSTGSVAVTDFMPVGRQLAAGTHDYVHLNAPGWIVRRVEGLQGDMELDVTYRPSRKFARVPAEIHLDEGAVRAGAEMPSLYCDVIFSISGDCVIGKLRITAKQTRDLVLADNVVEGESPLARVEEFFNATRAFWEEWISYCRYHGPYQETVRRSALVLKLLTYAPTGAMVAAPTTSLPEEIGGERNWDYRYCWVRDSCFMLYALAVLGYGGEADCFDDYLLHACGRSLPYVRPMYGIDGALQLEEKELNHLEGYMGSAPVRTGNGAYLQLQLDAYGQMLDLALMHKALGGELDEQYRRLLSAVANFIAVHWREPDQGIWEMRGPPRHHVHGKLMSWVGMDRAGQLLDPKWYHVAEEIAADICARGGPEDNEGLRQAYDGGTDAAVLLAPMLGFPLPEGTLRRTIEHVRQVLGRGKFLARYVGDDGIAGREGEFFVCTSWLIDAELACGDLGGARASLEHLIGCANDVGLYAEEVDASSGAFLGNFPQALTHLGVIGNIVNLQLAERHGADALSGTYADRARRAVTAIFGWRAVWAAILESGRVGRLFSSRHSKLAWP